MTAEQMASPPSCYLHYRVSNLHLRATSKTATAVYLVNTRATGELGGGLATSHRKLSEEVEQVDFKSRNKYSGSHRTEILTGFCYISSSQFTILFLCTKHEDIITLPFGKN